MPAGDSVAIRLPSLRALRVAARSVLVAVALLSLPWLRAAEAPPARRRTAGDDACGAAAAAQAELLVRDLHREGLLAPGARAVVLGAAGGGCDDAPVPRQDHPDDGAALRPASLRRMLMIGDSSMDFLLDLGFFDEIGDSFGFADRVLKHGGILAAPIGSLSLFSLPWNYRVIYVRRFAETFVGVMKTANAGENNNGVAGSTAMDVPLTASLKEGLLSGQPAESANGEFKNMGRKLLLSEKSMNHRWLQMIHQDQS